MQSWERNCSSWITRKGNCLWIRHHSGSYTLWIIQNYTQSSRPAYKIVRYAYFFTKMRSQDNFRCPHERGRAISWLASGNRKWSGCLGWIRSDQGKCRNLISYFLRFIFRQTRSEISGAHQLIAIWMHSEKEPTVYKPGARPDCRRVPVGQGNREKKKGTAIPTQGWKAKKS